jgi:predicted MPP superfamily phosphohydrolase
MAPLRLAPGATRFKVLQFTDLHFSLDGDASERTLAVMRSVLAAEPDADLVVYSGDLVTADAMFAPKKGPLEPSWFAKQWALALSPLEGRIPHAVALGNHDLVRGPASRLSESACVVAERGILQLCRSPMS